MGTTHRSDISIGQMHALELGAQARCQGCHAHQTLDLAKLIERKGPDYSLFDRCCVCPFKPSCGGRVRFFRLSPFMPLFSEVREYYWNELDYLEKHAGDRLWQRQEAWRRVCAMFADRPTSPEAERILRGMRRRYR